MGEEEEGKYAFILSLLPEDLLTRIHSLISDPTDLKSFRHVCRTFRHVDSLARTHLRPIRPEYLPVLLTNFPSLTSLDLSACPRVDDSFATAISTCLSSHQITTLSLHKATSLTRVGLTTLVRSCGPQTLVSIDVSHWCRRFGDREAHALSCGVALREIRLDKCLSVTDVGLAQIAVGCPKLEWLSLKWCLEITDLGIDLLTKKSLNLKYLDISSLKITNSSLASIAFLVMLKSLVMVGCSSIDDDGLGFLGHGCPSLKVLDISRCDGVTSIGLSSVIKGHRDLLQLHASHCMVDLTSAILHELKSLKSLSAFRVDGAWVSQSTFKTISTNCRSLIEIGLSKCIGLRDANIVQLVTGCSNLKILNLSCCNSVTNVAIAAVAASCRNLRCLKVESCSSITEKSLEFLGSSCALLEELDLTDCSGVNDTALNYLSVGCSELRILKLGLCDNISNKGLMYIASKCNKIYELDLYRCPGVGDDGMWALSNGCKKLKKLNICYCNGLTDRGIEYIGKLEELADLEMRGLVSVTGTGLQAVAIGCKRLTELDLKLCKNIQDSGFQAIAYYSKNIRQINLCHSAISDVALCMLMSNLTCLQDAKLVHLANVSVGGFELALRAGCIQLKKVKLLGSLKFSLSQEILHFLWSRGCKIRWD